MHRHSHMDSNNNNDGVMEMHRICSFIKSNFRLWTTTAANTEFIGSTAQIHCMIIIIIIITYWNISRFSSSVWYIFYIIFKTILVVHSHRSDRWHRLASRLRLIACRIYQWIVNYYHFPNEHHILVFSLCIRLRMKCILCKHSYFITGVCLCVCIQWPLHKYTRAPGTS